MQEFQTNPTLSTADLVKPLEPALGVEQDGEQSPEQRQLTIYNRLVRGLASSNKGGLALLAILHVGLKAASLAGPIFLRLIVKGLACKAKHNSGKSTEDCDDKGTLYL